MSRSSPRKDNISKHPATSIRDDESEGSESSTDTALDQSIQSDVPRVAQWVDEDDFNAELEQEDPTDHEDVEDRFMNLKQDLSKLPLGAIVKARKALKASDSGSDDESEDSDSSGDLQDNQVEDLVQTAKPRGPHAIEHRPNKHAPMEVSSRKPVTRRRQVVEVQRAKPRDPRFSDLTGSLSEHHFHSNYGFLNDLHNNELTTLKESLSRARKLLISSPRHLREEREREVQRLEQAVKRAESTVNRQRREEAERRALERVRKEEKDKRKSGKKNWWLKNADEKAIRVRARLDAIAETGGKRAVKKAIEKKQKKIGQKEKKSRPFARPERSDGSQKRQREESGTSERHKSSLRSLTWFLPGRFKDAELASEALSAILNVLSLYHDTIIGRRLAQAPKFKPLIPPSLNSRYTRGWMDKDRAYKWIARTLEMIRFLELVIEMGLRRKLGQKGRWRGILTLESIKAILRLIILKITRRPLVSPPIPERDFDPANLPPLDSDIFLPSAPAASQVSPMLTPEHLKNNHISLDAPHPLLTEKPTTNRSASPVENFLLSKALSPSVLKPPTTLIRPLSTPKEWLSEIAHILRPLIYVIALSSDTSGNSPLFISLFLDFASRYLRRVPPPSSILERSEYARRDRDLLWYFLRGQIWTLYTRPKLDSFVKKTASAPLLGLISAFVKDWIPLINEYYYYTAT